MCVQERGTVLSVLVCTPTGRSAVHGLHFVMACKAKPGEVGTDRVICITAAGRWKFIP